MAAQNVCFYNKYGFCKYLERCRKYHETEVCEKTNCGIRECSLRHPRVCKFFRDLGFCKFSEWCKFSHKLNKNNAVKNDELNKLEDRLKAVEFELENKNAKLLKLENEIKDVYVKVSEKDQTISKINKKLNVLNEKMMSIVNFETRFENLEKKVEKVETQSVKVTDSADAPSKPADDLKCSLCEFTGKNKFGLKIHFHKKHSTAKFKCFTCDFTCESYSDLMDHNEKYPYSHRQVLDKSYEKVILDEIQHLDQDGFLVHRTLDW